MSVEARWALLLSGVGVVACLAVFAALLNVSGWRGWGHGLGLYFVGQAVGAGVLLWRGRSFAGALLVLSGLGFFFSFLLSYADLPTVLGSFYPWALLAGTPWCVAGLWQGVQEPGPTR